MLKSRRSVVGMKNEISPKLAVQLTDGRRS